MPLTDYRLITFACFGTLIDRDSGLATALRPLVTRSGHGFRREAVLAAFAAHENAALGGSRSSGGARTYSEVLSEAHRRLARDWAVTCAPDEHALFARSVGDWPAFPDVAGALQYLKRYFRLAVLSNADRDTIRGIGRRLDLQFDAVWSAEDIGSFKPDRRNFDYLLARLGRLGVGAGQSLHVAASLPHDLVPAATSGLACAWIDREGVSQASETARPFEYVFRSVAHLVRAHQEDLRA